MAKVKQEVSTADNGDSDSRLRDIQKLLFGEQQSHLERDITQLRESTLLSLDKLEKQCVSEIGALRTTIQQQIHSLESHVESLNQERKTAEAGLDDAITSLSNTLHKFQQQTESAHQATEQLLFSELEKLTKQTLEQHNQLANSTTQQFQSLSESKVERATLAKLLSQIATSLEETTD